MDQVKNRQVTRNISYRFEKNATRKWTNFLGKVFSDVSQMDANAVLFAKDRNLLMFKMPVCMLIKKRKKFCFAVKNNQEICIN